MPEEERFKGWIQYCRHQKELLLATPIHWPTSKSSGAIQGPSP